MDSAEFIEKLRQPNLFSDVIILDETDSTNLFAKNNPVNTPALISADYQTSGRGRFSRKWLSRQGENLTFTIVIDINLKNENIFAVNFYVSLMLYFALSELLPSEKIILKWPNDLLIENKKVCGILTETENLPDYLRRFIIGVGLNVNQTSFSGLSENEVTSIKNVSGIHCDRYELLFTLAKNILIFKDALFVPERILFLWKKFSGFVGRNIRFRKSDDSEIITGVVTGLSSDGAVVILSADNKKLRFYSGEISFIL